MLAPVLSSIRQATNECRVPTQLPARVRLLADILPLAPSTISQHVTILKEAGLICASSDEQRVCYCVNPERLQQLKALIGGL